METDYVRIKREHLQAFCQQVFQCLSLSEHDARTAAAVLVAADARGIPSHDVARLWRYVNGLQTGSMLPDAPVEVLVDTPSSIVIHAHGAMGAPVSVKAMESVIVKAKTNGAAFGCVRDSNHFGIAGYYAMLALDEDEFTRRYEQLDISMCAHGPAVTLISAAKELGAGSAELVKYQTSGDTTGDYAQVVGYAGVIIRAAAMHPLAALARETVETYVREGKTPPPPAAPTPEMQAQAGVFVSIHKLGALRGCIGTFEPQQVNVAEEIITNAVSSATRDPRFPPIAPEELKDLDYSVDVLTLPEPVDDASQLDPRKYGVIVEAGMRRGLLLPDLEGVDTVDYQIDICRQKGGIASDEPVQLYRFEVNRFK